MTEAESRHLERRLRALGIACRPGALAPLPIRRNPAPAERRIDPKDETAELRRRMDWLGERVPMEVVIESLERELRFQRRR